jgi:transcriptional regulator with XRE-family HTH domain
MLNEDRPADSTALASVVAENIRNLRIERGLAPEALAAAAGLDAEAWDNLEAGRGDPGIETLWAVAAALGVPFSQLVEQELPRVRVVRADEGVPIDAEGADLSALLKLSSSRRATFEVYLIDSEPGEAHRADGHIEGSIEHLMVLQGRMRAGPIDAPAELAAGDLATFAGDAPHLYETLAPGTRALLLMEYP